MPQQILVISDNGSFAAYLCELLEEAGHAVTPLVEQTGTVTAVRRLKPDLIVLAVEAAKVASLAVEHRVQTPLGPRPVPLIVISECLRLEAELLHVFDFIPVPLDVKRLLDGVAAIAGRGAAPAGVPEITDGLYREFSGHILSCTGLHFELRNRPALLRGLARRMSALRMEGYPEYLSYLRLHGEDRHELQKLLQFLTVGETYFFRYPAHFEALTDRFRRKPPAVDEPIRIWSAGCSSGEEPYSIAIALMEALPDWKSRDIKVIATDINNRSLKQARDGVYSPWSMRSAQKRQVARYFDRVGQSFLIKEEVKGLVQFSHLNLLAPGTDGVRGELVELDAVFCRNVLIYFTQETAQRLLFDLSRALKLSGQLFLGHAEALLQHPDELEPRRFGKSFYYRKRRPRPRAASPSQAPNATLMPLPGRLSAEQGGIVSRTPFGAPPARETAPPPPPAACPAPAPQPAQCRRPGVQAARDLFDQEEYDRALEFLERLLAETPAAAEALVLKGFIEAGKGELEKALATCDHAIEVDDLRAEAYFLRGVILDASDQLDEAADEYRKALLLEHDFIMPRYHMGRLHLRLGRLTEAAREIRNSIRILSRYDDDATVPYSGGLTRTVCMLQLQNALAQVA